MNKTINAVTETASAKINLYLEVTNRRANGYHDLDSLVVFADVGERLTAYEADELSLDIEGPMAGALAQENDNLILRAARLLREEAGVSKGASLRLEKHIPVAAGVGGGSADAAAALRALNVLWQVGADEGDLMRLGLRLGADVPVCIRSRTSRFQGIGDICSDGPVLPKGLGICLVNPRVAVSTKGIFALVQPKEGSVNGPLPSDFSSCEAFKDWLAERRNDLMHPASSKEPVVQDCLDALNGANEHAFVRMSGSGATCFALCATVKGARHIYRHLMTSRPDWWMWSGNIL